MSGEASLIEVRGVGKNFGAARVLEGVDLDVRRGEVLALLGENGAGKSTLMKILAGVQTADQGEIRIDGKARRFSTVGEALASGIALIHQELNLATNLDVAGNVFLGREPRRLGWIDRGKMAREARVFLQQAGLEVDPSTPLSTLSIAKRQQVEIAKALSVDARVLIMDEPTSSLSVSETERLFEVIRNLKARGVAIIYISHRLGEVCKIADRVEVLRDGRHVGSLARDEITHEAMVRLMVGRDLEEFYPRHEQRLGEVMLEVRGLRTQTYPACTVEFSIRSGEIVGIAGLVGAGRSEVLRAVFGADKRRAGTVLVSGKALHGGSVRSAIAAGLAMVPEDRKAEGLVLPMGVSENLNLAVQWQDRLPGGFINLKRERERSAELSDALRIKSSPDQQVGQLSGGNQQKVALGKWLAMASQVLLLDEPTRGVDVGAKREIYTLMEELADQGKAVLFVSSDLTEVLGMADRVFVMHEGRIAGCLKRGEATEESVMNLATGAGKLQTLNA